MAQDRYFVNFPTTTYNTANVVNIVERTVILNGAIKNPYLFYPYDISVNERPDQFANRYYGDSYKSWLLYMANQITDPYYGWYLTTDEFNDFLNLKYASVSANCPSYGFQLATAKIKYYENNWYASDNIDVNTFDALPSALIPYWAPVYSTYNNIAFYQRKSISQQVTTNGIRSYVVSNTSFVDDEIVNIVFDTNDIGQGQIASINANTNTIYVQHISGTVLATPSSGSYIYGQESQNNTSLISASFVIDNIPNIEQVYWNPVTYYTYEDTKNQSNKSIKILDKSYAANVAIDLKNLLASNT